jgi:hypothetical protein
MPLFLRNALGREAARSVSAAIGFALATTFAFIHSAQAAPKTTQIRIEYAEPKNAAHKPLYERMKDARVLEYVQSILGVIRLPRPLKIKLTGCEGISNAWYSDDEITVCYEFVDDIYKNAAEADLPVGITRQDTIVGPLVDVFLHEAGHAVFDYLKVPIFGREEDAADQFSAYIVLQYDKERARRLILGSAYQYRLDVKTTDASMPVSKFADEHGLPAQRFYNVLCTAYGRDPKLFAELVTMKYLPESRAEQCEHEYEQVKYAFGKLITPHINRTAARKVLKKRYQAKKL